MFEVQAALDYVASCVHEQKVEQCFRLRLITDTDLSYSFQNPVESQIKQLLSRFNRADITLP